jgi:hypothetical protein
MLQAILDVPDFVTPDCRYPISRQAWETALSGRPVCRASRRVGAPDTGEKNTLLRCGPIATEVAIAAATRAGSMVLGLRCQCLFMVGWFEHFFYFFNCLHLALRGWAGDDL